MKDFAPAINHPLETMKEDWLDPFNKKETQSKSVQPFRSYDATNRHTQTHFKPITPI